MRAKRVEILHNFFYEWASFDFNRGGQSLEMSTSSDVQVGSL